MYKIYNFTEDSCSCAIADFFKHKINKRCICYSQLNVTFYSIHYTIWFDNKWMKQLQLIKRYTI